jgi:hypothetical protein
MWIEFNNSALFKIKDFLYRLNMGERLAIKNLRIIGATSRGFCLCADEQTEIRIFY